MKKVALFATCIVDTLKPEIGFATLRLLQAAGCDVSIPSQSCCGQANYNGGDIQGAQALAKQWLEMFEPYEYIVIPSGSCAAMLKRHSPSLFDDAETRARMQALAEKSYELSEFLTEIASPEFQSSSAQKVSYHDSCSGLRELGIKHQPRKLLSKIPSLQLKPLSNAEACCGFGGAFCVKHPEISCHLADDKIRAIDDAGVDTLLGGDWGCLMHLQGRIEARGKAIKVMHFSELLAEAIKQ